MMNEDEILALHEQASDLYARARTAQEEGDVFNELHYFEKASMFFEEAGQEFLSAARQARHNEEYASAGVWYQRSCNAYLQAYHALVSLSNVTKAQTPIASLEAACRNVKMLSQHARVTREFTQCASEHLEKGIRRLAQSL